MQTTSSLKKETLTALDKMDQTKDNALEVVNRIKDVSSDAANQTVDFIKKYPLYSAIGAAAVGFLAGYIGKKIK
ncbi:MAG: hypothetical protein M9962_07940 [Oligoflexia bacterium]|nr:hypothetical protein [Oligoflexia bacterium]